MRFTRREQRATLIVMRVAHSEQPPHQLSSRGGGTCFSDSRLRLDQPRGIYCRNWERRCAGLARRCDGRGLASPPITNMQLAWPWSVPRFLFSRAVRPNSLMLTIWRGRANCCADGRTGHCGEAPRLWREYCARRELRGSATFVLLPSASSDGRDGRLDPARP